jgi:predicted DNA-binding mobile mystery protein A
MNFNHIKIKQLDRKLKRNISLSKIELPREGWIKEIRKALKMSYSQLAKRLSVTPNAIKKFEDSEMQGTISLNSLNKIANAMDCRVVYAFVPNESFEKIIDNQIDKVAEKMVQRVYHSMRLEDQNLSDEILKEQLNELKYDLKNNFSSKIWNYEI